MNIPPRLIKYRALALCCASALSAAANPARADAMPSMVVGRVGQSPIAMIFGAKAMATAATMRQQWLASGHRTIPAAGTLALTGGTVVKNTVVVGIAQSYPALSFTFTAGSAGFSGANFIFTSPSGAQSYFASYTQGPYATQGSAAFASVVPPGLYSQPGAWTLTSATLFDHAGNSVSYDSVQLAALFTGTSFNVVNQGPIDAVAPTILGGRVLTSTVSLSSPAPVFETKIAASDAGGAGLYNVYVFITAPLAGYSFAGITPLALPITRGVVETYDRLTGQGSPGNWTIYGYAVCDFASNCTQSNSSVDVQNLFGTTHFTVTQ